MGLKSIQPRTYHPEDVAIFWKTRERFGGLSNMAAGFPITVNGTRIRTSEALYQACRFPHLPKIQKLIISQISPMTAKMRGKPFAEETRPDWHEVRVPVMRWCLRAKLCQNPAKFGKALAETEGAEIVEKKVRRTDFWGAKVQEDGTLQGLNVLGRLLMELREEFLVNGPPKLVKPLSIPRFELYGEPIEDIMSAQEVVGFGF
jgi:ribA/ribD-fused uncharacterized protein